MPPKKAGSTESGRVGVVDPGTWHSDDEVQFDLRLRVEGLPNLTLKVDVLPGGVITKLSLEVVGKAAGGGITRRLLRQLPVGEMQAIARATVRKELDTLSLGAPGISVSPALREHFRHLSDDFVRRRRPGSAGRDDVFYAGFAAEYVELLDQTPRPVKVLCERHNIGASEVRNRLYGARQRNLLTDAPPGRAGGELTEKAKELLRGTR